MTLSALCVGQWNYKPRACSTRWAFILSATYLQCVKPGTSTSSVPPSLTLLNTPQVNWLVQKGRQVCNQIKTMACKISIKCDPFFRGVDSAGVKTLLVIAATCVGYPMSAYDKVVVACPRSVVSPWVLRLPPSSKITERQHPHLREHLFSV